jgi:hypothetical protein
MEKREMKNIKGWLTGGTLAAVLLFGSTFAKADPGIIFGVADSGTSTDRTATKATTVTRNDTGIIFGKDGIIFGKAGIIFGITGIIFG